MITKKQNKHLKRLISTLVKAEVANSWAGSGDPIDIGQCHLYLEYRRNLLNHYLASLTERE